MFSQWKHTEPPRPKFKLLIDTSFWFNLKFLEDGSVDTETPTASSDYPDSTASASEATVTSALEPSAPSPNPTTPALSFSLPQLPILPFPQATTGPDIPFVLPDFSPCPQVPGRNISETVKSILIWQDSIGSGLSSLSRVMMESFLLFAFLKKSSLLLFLLF